MHEFRDKLRHKREQDVWLVAALIEMVGKTSMALQVFNFDVSYFCVVLFSGDTRRFPRVNERLSREEDIRSIESRSPRAP